MKSSYVLLIIITLAFMFWFYERDKSLTDSNVARELVPETVTASRLPAPTDASLTLNSPTRLAAAPAAADPGLQQQLDDARYNLDQQLQTLNALKQQQSERTQQLSQSYPYYLNDYNSQIQNLSENLQSLSTAENNLNQETSLRLQEQISSTQLARDQINPAIMTVEQDMRRLMDQLAILEGISLRSNEQETQYQSLQLSLQNQRQQLDTLRQQKIDLAAAALEQVRSISSLSLQQKFELADSRAQIQNELFSLRQLIGEMQNARAQTRMSLVPLSQQINQAQQNYEMQLQRVQEMETRLNQQ